MREARLEALRSRLAGLGRPTRPRTWPPRLRDLGEVVTDASVRETVSELRRNSTGAGPLDALLAEPGVSDVLVNGPREVFVDRGEGLERADVTFVDDEQVRRLAIRLAAAADRRLDDAAPFVDGRLPDGTRLHAVLAPVAEPGDLPVAAGARASLVRAGGARLGRGSLPPDGADILRALVARQVRSSSPAEPAPERARYSPRCSRWSRRRRGSCWWRTRGAPSGAPALRASGGPPPSGEGAGAIALTTLVRQALRMRPDRVVLGEVRGGELTDLLTALNTGHEGGCGTVHANSLADIPARLEALAALGGLGREACHAQVAARSQGRDPRAQGAGRGAPGGGRRGLSSRGRRVGRGGTRGDLRGRRRASRPVRGPAGRAGVAMTAAAALAGLAAVLLLGPAPALRWGGCAVAPPGRVRRRRRWPVVVGVGVAVASSGPGGESAHWAGR